MDAKGYVKLVDLGLAKQIPTGSTWCVSCPSTYEPFINIACCCNLFD